MKKKLTHYLFERLEQCGAELTFGIPGDFALPIYAQQAEYGLKTIVCTHEPNCVFAADAYSRLKGLGAVLTTYGVGGLNMINPVAMAYAELSPLVVISGAPAIAGRMENPAFHHLVKDYGSQQRVFEEVTCATSALTNTVTAAEEINRVLDACLTFKRPGYIEIPLDMTAIEIPVPEIPAKCHSGPSTNNAAMKEAAREILAAFEQAERPILYTGVGVRRHGLMDAIKQIAETWGIPVVSSVMGKASFPESHKNHVGIYMGEMGDSTAREMIENSDLILSVGVIYSDVNTGFWTAKISAEQRIDMRDLEIKISHHTYTQVPLGAIINYLAEQAPQAKQLPAITKAPEQSAPQSVTEKLNTAELIRVLKKLNQTEHSFLADVGDAWFAGLEIDADIFMAPGYYASMGFAVPGAVGAALAAPDLRPIVLVGDGAFQMTGSELSTLVANNLNPIVIVLNNGYYKMLSALDKHRDYYNLNNWDYVKYAEALGCAGERVETGNELDKALEHALSSDKVYLIEALLHREDHAPMMQNIRNYFKAAGDKK
ncbi:alpha-keto acid decarboxylase family protein [Desulfosediminicola flagellatus]|uniref:alpha-keto acid decarboxylase family protein n=1 Tax=Desulfosediminicola flagellatus TaxID=2569541 RepID=UPI0010AB6D38|nr:thiamine pyrophosphate-dependent enzyme [Desulfosediminicola flagellatus]